MKAQVITHFGDTSVFETQELPIPELKPGYVLIRVAATSVNPVDYKIRSGRYQAMVSAFPAVLHGDVAGVVEAVASDVSAFKVGDEVFGCAGGIKTENGALAEYMLADARLIAKKPKSLSMAEAAALPLVSITAWEGLFVKTTLKPNQKILIHAGTGGVGHIAIQLAKWAGAEVYTTISSEDKAALAKSLGAKETINYREESVQDYVARLTNNKGFDVVFDTVGGENIDKSIAAIALNGHILTIQANSTHDLAPLHAKAGSLHVVFMLIPLIYNLHRERHGEILKRIATIVDEGSLKPLLDPHTFSFEEVGNAHALLESGKAIGKVVVQRT
jgi:NADPH2:quinone reductase